MFQSFNMANVLKIVPMATRPLCKFLPKHTFKRNFRVQPRIMSNMTSILSKNAMPRWSHSISMPSHTNPMTDEQCSRRTICEHISRPHHVPNLTSPVPSHQDTTRNLLLRSTPSRFERKYHRRNDEPKDRSVLESSLSSPHRSRLLTRQDREGRALGPSLRPFQEKS